MNGVVGGVRGEKGTGNELKLKVSSGPFSPPPTLVINKSHLTTGGGLNGRGSTDAEDISNHPAIAIFGISIRGGEGLRGVVVRAFRSSVGLFAGRALRRLRAVGEVFG